MRRPAALLRVFWKDGAFSLLGGFLIAAIVLFFFLNLASEVMEGDTRAFDVWLLQALRTPADPSVPIGPRWFRIAMIDITALGGTSVLSLLTVIAVGYLVAARKPETAVFLGASVAGGAVTGTLLKLIFARARPDIVPHLVFVDSASFPSGHALNSAVTYLTIGALLARAESKRTVRIYLIAVAVALSLTIGFSRVYAGVHWPSDVVGGWCVGAAWAMIISLIARALQRRRTIEPPPAPDPS